MNGGVDSLGMKQNSLPLIVYLTPALSSKDKRNWFNKYKYCKKTVKLSFLRFRMKAGTKRKHVDDEDCRRLKALEIVIPRVDYEVKSFD